LEDNAAVGLKISVLEGAMNYLTTLGKADVATHARVLSVLDASGPQPVQQRIPAHDEEEEK
jgi:hypothetical protein